MIRFPPKKRVRPTPGGWVVVAGRDVLRNADDVHVTRAAITNRPRLSAVCVYREDARRLKHKIVREKNLQGSNWLAGCEIDP